ncbi:hypothetical protein Ancab_002084 [Ancistrocladus abbreviatus]
MDRIIFGFVVLILALTSSTSLRPTSDPFRPLPARDDLLKEYQNYTAISKFRTINRQELIKCPIESPYIEITTSPDSDLPDEVNITVTVSGVIVPASSDWVAMITPATADVNSCPTTKAQYVQTGDLANLPLLCHYPVKAQYLSEDPDYLSCKKSECKKSVGGVCLVKTCSASITFHAVNMRTNISFAFFALGFDTPCLLKMGPTIKFANPSSPLYAHLSSIDSTGTSMRVTWISGDNQPQQVKYGNGQTQTSDVTTFTQKDMCTTKLLPSPASDFGWHDPGYIHTAVMTGLQPLMKYSYMYGSDSVGWSNQIQFQTPPAGGSDELTFLAFGDMGKAPLDKSLEHYINPGAPSVIQAMTDAVTSSPVDCVMHIGDISYATGFMGEWDFFFALLYKLASRLSYMSGIGNHERYNVQPQSSMDYPFSGSIYITPDSGGECGVAYETYFPLPTPAKDKPWYSIELGPVHFTIISTEHDFRVGTEQYKWMQSDMASVNRSTTPWLIFMGHRPMYTSIKGGPLSSVDPRFVAAVEPLLKDNRVDLALFGHVHNYERTCAIYQGNCLAMPKKDSNGVDTYDFSNYSAPVQVVLGMAGFVLDPFTSNPDAWSLVRISEFGYTKTHATRTELAFEFVNANTRQVQDSFRITKS